MAILHPARTIPYRALADALKSAREARLLSEQAAPYAINRLFDESM